MTARSLPARARTAAAAALLLVLLLLPMASGCTVVRLGDIEPPEGTRVVTSIRIDGNSQLSTSAITGRLESRVQAMSVAAKDALVDEAAVGVDARRIEAIYAANGYFRARVTDYWIEDLANRTARLVFRVNEGAPTKVIHVDFGEHSPVWEDDPEEAKRLAEVLDALPDLVSLQVGDTWTDDDYNAGISQISAAFRRRGFIFATVTGDNYISRQRSEAGVYYRIYPGPLTRIKEIRVTGNDRISDQRIMRRVHIKPGEVVDPVQLALVEDQITALNMFFSVSARAVKTEGDDHQEDPEAVKADSGVAPETTGEAPTETPETTGEAPTETPETTGEAPTETPETSETSETSETTGEIDAPAAADTPPNNETQRISRKVDPRSLPRRVPVEIAVQERSLFDATIGLGASTDSLKAELYAPLTGRLRNPFGLLSLLSARAKPAIVIPDISGSWGDFELGIDTALIASFPSLFEEYLHLSTGIGYKIDPSQETITNDWWGSVGVDRFMWVRHLLGRVGWNFVRKIYVSGALTTLDPKESYNISAFRSKGGDFAAFIDLKLTYDLRDNPMDPHRGFFASALVNLAAPWVGSEVSYVKTSLDLRGYIPLAPWLTLAVRNRLGYTFFPQSQGTPEAGRFKSGGPTTHRGFENGRMGDYVCKTPVNGKQTNVPCDRSAKQRTYIGGNVLFEGNVELRFAISSLLGFVAFVDYGQMWSWSKDVDLSDLTIAVGPGARLFTPVGPLRVDFSFVIKNPSTSSTLWFISLGQAF